MPAPAIFTDCKERGPSQGRLEAMHPESLLCLRPRGEVAAPKPDCVRIQPEQNPGPWTSCGQNTSREWLSCIFASLLKPIHHAFNRFLPWRAQSQPPQWPPGELLYPGVRGFLSCPVLCSWSFFPCIFPVWFLWPVPLFWVFQDQNPIHAVPEPAS